MKKDDSKAKEQKKKKKKQPLNKKRLNNKVLKAKEVLTKNREAMKHPEHLGLPDIPMWKRVLYVIKRVFFWVMIAILAVTIVSFVLIRVRGGTPTVFGYSIQRVTSGSMEPNLMVGDIILSKQTASPDEIDTDDIITFKGGAAFEYHNVTHRVVVPPMKNINGDYVLMTKGDANTKVDGEIYYADVQSKMVRKLEFLNRFFEFFMSPWGLIIFIGALILIFFDELLTLAKIFTGNYHEDEEEESLRDTMKRIKAEEEEQKRLEEELREKKRMNPRKYDSTSNRKKKNRKKQSKAAGAELIASGGDSAHPSAKGARSPRHMMASKTKR